MVVVTICEENDGNSEWDLFLHDNVRKTEIELFLDLAIYSYLL